MYVCNFDGRYIFNLQWSRKKNHTALTGHLAEKQIQGAHINLKSLFSCGYKCCCLTACVTFSPFVATLEHYDACSRKDLAERKKKTLQRNMFAFLQHNTGDNWNVDCSGSIEKAKDVVDCNPDKDENDIGDPDLEMWLIPSFVLYVYYWDCDH